MTQRGRSSAFVRPAAAWERSAANEQRVTAILEHLPVGDVVFHDVQLPRPSTVVVDHLVVSRRGIWVIDVMHSDDPVTVGRGRASDTLWAGRTSLRPALEASDWAAETVGRLLGVHVEPIMCLVAPSVPEPTFEFNGIRICQPETLASPLLTPGAPPVDLASIVRSVNDVFGAEPSTPADLPTLSPVAMADRSVVAPYPTRRTTIGARVHAVRRSVAFRLGVLVAAGAAAVVYSSTLTAAWDAAVDRVGDVAGGLMDSTSDEPTLFAGPVTHPTAARFVATCPEPGAGWELGWVWPGELPARAFAYDIRLDTGVAGPRVAVDGWTDATVSPTPYRLDGSAPKWVLTDYVDEAGAILATTRQIFPDLGGC